MLSIFVHVVSMVVSSLLLLEHKDSHLNDHTFTVLKLFVQCQEDAIIKQTLMTC